MAIGVISGTLQNGTTYEIVFESYYQPAQSATSPLDGLITLPQNIAAGIASLSTQKTAEFRVLAFDGFQRDGAGRWATHEIIGQDRKPLLEFIGPDLEQISFSIFLSATLGLNPEEELQKLRALRDGGAVCDFVLGSQLVNGNQWVITKVSEAHKTFDGSGSLLVASVNVSLTEYVKLPGEDE